MLYRLIATLMTNSEHQCPNCRWVSAQGALFCSGCGESLPAAQAPIETAGPGTEAAQTPWTLWNITAGLFLFLGLLFVLYFVNLVIGFIFPSYGTALTTWVTVHLAAACAFFTVWVMGLRKAASPLSAIGLTRPGTSPGVTAALTIAALAFSIIASFVYGFVVDRLGIEALRPPEIDDDVIFYGFGVLLTLEALALVTPLSEEVMFRGFVLRGLLNRIGPGPAVVSTAVVFSVFHLDAGTIIPIFFTGLALGWLYIKTGSLWPCIVAHGSQNAIVVLALWAGW